MVTRPVITGMPLRLCIENSLHEDQIKPSPKLESDFPEMGDLSKTKPAMEFDRAVIRRVYRADHDVLVESERVGKHSLDQLSSNPRAARGRSERAPNARP